MLEQVSCFNQETKFLSLSREKLKRKKNTKKKTFNCLSHAKLLHKRKMHTSLPACLGPDNVKSNIYACINFFLNELYVY
ncbi:unnamed protein product [Brassica rapa]|uniref:Uncharacterized protein n=1 Tax=Brassica campestris TaxID=3711 RepID=A0A8D9I3Y5_BRACM|nr:unnamed protein product [Brassica rapa]